MTKRIRVTLNVAPSKKQLTDKSNDLGRQMGLLINEIRNEMLAFGMAPGRTNVQGRYGKEKANMRQTIGLAVDTDVTDELVYISQRMMERTNQDKLRNSLFNATTAQPNNALPYESVAMRIIKQKVHLKRFGFGMSNPIDSDWGSAAGTKYVRDNYESWYAYKARHDESAKRTRRVLIGRKSDIAGGFIPFNKIKRPLQPMPYAMSGALMFGLSRTAELFIKTKGITKLRKQNGLTDYAIRPEFSMDPSKMLTVLQKAWKLSGVKNAKARNQFMVALVQGADVILEGYIANRIKYRGD